MLTLLEVLIIAANIPVLIWALLPVKRVPRFLDFMPLSAVVFLVLHLFIDNESVRLRFIPLYIFTIATFLITIMRIFHHRSDQPRRRILAGAGRIFGLLLLTICVLIPTVVIPFYPLPEPTGSYHVGTIASDFTDRNRMEAFSKEEGVLRKVAVQFWYPTEKLETESLNDISGAPISTKQQDYPVLIFSHGAFGVRMSNASTFRELASHGYIVASIDHTYQAFYTSFADGESIPASSEFLNDAMKVQTDNLDASKTFQITHDWLDLRAADIELVIDSLASGNLGNEAKMLIGHMDLTKIGLFGHSLGGAAAAQVCRDREDIKAVVVLDGTMIGDIKGVKGDGTDIITDESFDKPLMLMYGSLFQSPEAKRTSYQSNIKAFENATDAAYSVCIKDSGHLNFTDLPRISPFLSGMLGVGTVDSLECIKTVNAYSLDFFDKHLKGQASSLLEGTTSSYSEVLFDKR
ncbi:MAG: platelet-activating factor acetylhydrolase, plasma/intracellular isoform [Clostridia bacterium]|jgi:dienelactone hydrolase|nr:platelet-activating factor acetylhydrolase, plasma/intracellular isoform [Clostridia bacterium]